MFKVVIFLVVFVLWFSMKDNFIVSELNMLVESEVFECDFIFFLFVLVLINCFNLVFEF